MKPSLTNRQSQMFHAIRAYIAEHGYSPTVREIGKAMNINSPNGVMFHLNALKRKGFIDWEPGKARTIRVLREV